MAKRTFKRGEILLNLWAGYKTLFMYLGSNGSMAYGVALTEVDGKNRIRRANYYLSSLADRERFPTVGFIDVQGMWEKAFEEALYDIREVNDRYGPDGHRKQGEKK